jgi:hypothetical protein
MKQVLLLCTLSDTREIISRLIIHVMSCVAPQERDFYISSCDIEDMEVIKFNEISVKTHKFLDFKQRRTIKQQKEETRSRKSKVERFKTVSDSSYGTLVRNGRPPPSIFPTKTFLASRCSGTLASFWSIFLDYSRIREIWTKRGKNLTQFLLNLFRFNGLRLRTLLEYLLTSIWEKTVH